MAQVTTHAYQVINQSKFTPGGSSYFKQALNGFSDIETTPVGFPDGHGSNTCVRSFSIPVPISVVGGIAGPLYNCAIVFTPMDIPAQFDSPGGAGKVGNTFTSVGAIPRGVYGGVSIIQADPAVTPNLAFGTPGVINLAPIAIPANFISLECFRVVSFSMELVNTTPPLSAGGSCTVWTQPRSDTELGTWTDTFAAGNIRHFAAEQLRPDPNLLAEAGLLRGTETWPAIKGAYMNARLTQPECPLVAAGYENPIIMLDENITVSTLNIMVVPGVPGSGATNASVALHKNAFDPMGIQLRDLPRASTFTLTCRWVIENIPSMNSPLITLARPTLGVDHRALAALMLAYKRLPAGCPVTDNASGDWIKGVAAVVKGISGMLVSSGNPYAMAGGAAGYIVGDIMDSYTPKAPIPQRPPRVEPQRAIVYGPQLPRRKAGQGSKRVRKKYGDLQHVGGSLKGLSANERNKVLSLERLAIADEKQRKANARARKALKGKRN